MSREIKPRFQFIDFSRIHFFIRRKLKRVSKKIYDKKNKEELLKENHTTENETQNAVTSR